MHVFGARPAEHRVEFVAAATRRATSAVAQFRRALVRSLFPSEPTDLAVVDEQLALAYASSRMQILVGSLASTFLSLMEYRILPLWHVLLWPCLITASYLAADAYYRGLLRHADHSPADIRCRARALPRLTLVLSVLWCAMCYDLLIPGNVESEAVMFTVIACSLSAWSSIGSYHLATAGAAMPAYGLTLMAMAFAAGRPGGFLIAGIALAFWVLMRAHLMSNYTMRERLLRLEQERHQLIDNLQAAKGESDAARGRAELASRAKSAFLANMSHELRTPLNAILGFSELISSKVIGPRSTDQYAEYGGYIHNSGEHLLSLINDILDLAKIEAGRLTLRETEVDLRRLMDEIAKMMGAKAIASGLVFAVHVERAFPPVLADERALRQILVNLASNAIKFTPPGGRVTAFASVLADGWLSFGIDDTGIGIAPEEHTKVFESFGQGRHDAVLADKGTGLGLPIVKGLAEAHGGRVELNSAPDDGTRITVLLPPERARRRLKAAV
jgi:two-component system, cell cycle sensor histidine kinase PleC